MSFAPSGGMGGLTVQVSNRTGEIAIGVNLLEFPGLVGGFDAGLLLRSYITGGTQVGGDAILSFENTVEDARTAILAAPPGLGLAVTTDYEHYKLCRVEGEFTWTGQSSTSYETTVGILEVR